MNKVDPPRIKRQGMIVVLKNKMVILSPQILSYIIHDTSIKLYILT